MPSILKGGQFELVDVTDELNFIPAIRTITDEMGLFEPENLQTSTVQLEKSEQTVKAFVDVKRGLKGQSVNRDNREIYSFVVPHFPVVDQITPEDVAGRTRPGSKGREFDTVTLATMRVMEKIRRGFTLTMEKARMHTLITGTAYSPGGTIVDDFNAKFGHTRQTVNFDFANVGANIIESCNEVVQGFNGELQEGEVLSKVIAFCSPSFFSKLIKHPQVNQTYLYQNFQQNVNILHDRPGGLGINRRFTFENIEFIEIGYTLGGSADLPAGECIFIGSQAMNADGSGGTFKTYFSPANKLDHVNTIAMPMYGWTYTDPKGSYIEIEAESNFLNVINRPSLIINGTST